MITLRELQDKLLETYDPDVLVEKLALTSEDIVEQFVDKIEERYESLVEEFQEEDDE
jgi:hypothetical protein